MRVSTLMHLDDLPAELAGWGPVHAELARRMVKRQIGGEWRFAICDTSGQLIFAGVTRRRPSGWPPRPVTGPPGRRGIVELQMPLTMLRRWHADRAALGGWAHVIDDLAAQVDQHINSEHATARPDGRRDKQGGERRRFAVAGLRRWVQIRDRVCTYPGCRAPASRSELDHTREYAKGGATADANLAAACVHDHDLRDHGWRVIQSDPGRLVWISRTGHRYPVNPPLIIEPLPEPLLIGSVQRVQHQPGPPVSVSGASSRVPADPDIDDELPPSGAAEYAPPWLEPHPGPPQESQLQPPPQPEPKRAPVWEVPPF